MSRWLPVVAAAAVAALVIGKVWLAPNCLAFDENDDANHTFASLTVARSALAAGELPWMNPYNNFGTPIVGDTLTFPFAPQALTYALLKNDALASTVNRAVIAFLTMLALTAFFSGWMSRWAAAASAAMAFATPGFLWHFAHHQYQLALLVFAVQLLLQDRLGRRWWAFPALCLVSAVTFIAMNASVSLLLIGFALAYRVFRSDLRIDRRVVLALGAVAAGLVATWPETGSFLRYAGTALRSNYRYAEQIFATPRELLTGWVFQPAWSDSHLGFALHVPLGVTILAMLGLARIRRSQRLMCLTLGVLPVILVAVITIVPGLWAALPYLRSADVSRVLWFSAVFLLVPFGVAIDRIAALPLARETARRLATSAVLVAGAALLAFDGHRMSRASVAIAFLFIAALLAAARGWQARWVRPLIIASALAGAVPFAGVVLGYWHPLTCEGTHEFARAEAARFQPDGVLEQLVPGSRLAIDDDAPGPNEMKALYAGFLGGAARSVVIDRELATSLLARDLIDLPPHGPPYYRIRTDPPNELSPLGIRYFLALREPAADRLRASGWIDKGAVAGVRIFENPLPAPIAHVAYGPSAGVTIRPNGFDAVWLPVDRPGELTATFGYRHGWQAWSDGRPRAVYAGDDRFLRVHLEPGDRSVAVRFRPYSLVQVFEWMAAGLVLAIAAGLIARRTAA